MPGHTIHGAIKYHNSTVNLSNDQLNELMCQFNILNDNKCPKAGQSFKIPVLTQR